MKVTEIILNYRARVEATGHIKPLRSGSPFVAGQKPGSVLLEQTNHVTVSRSPFAILFDDTLPKLEPVLMVLGEDGAEAAISRLCEHAKAVIEQHGHESSEAYLKELFENLPSYESRLIIGELGHIIAAYERLYFDGKAEDFLRLNLGDKIESLKAGKSGKLSLKFKNTVTDLDLIFLKRVTNIEVLDLSLTKITGSGLEYIKDHKSLRILNLSESRVSDRWLAWLSGLTGLEEFDLQGTGVTNNGTQYLKNLTNLRKLNLSRTQITNAGMANVGELVNLESLLVCGMVISDMGLKHISGLIRLRELDLSQTEITNAGIRHLRGLTGLIDLNLRGTRIGDAGIRQLAALSELEVLNLAGTSLTDAGLMSLKGLRKLRRLYIGSTKISSVAIEKLKKGIPGIKISRT